MLAGNGPKMGTFLEIEKALDPESWWQSFCENYSQLQKDPHELCKILSRATEQYSEHFRKNPFLTKIWLAYMATH